LTGKRRDARKGKRESPFALGRMITLYLSEGEQEDIKNEKNREEGGGRKKRKVKHLPIEETLHLTFPSTSRKREEVKSQESPVQIRKRKGKKSRPSFSPVKENVGRLKTRRKGKRGREKKEEG